MLPPVRRFFCLPSNRCKWCKHLKKKYYSKCPEVVCLLVREITLGGFNCRSYLIQPLTVLGDSCWEDSCQQILCCIKCPASYNLYILHPIYLTSYISPMKPRNIFVHWFILSYEGYASIRPPKKNSLSGRIQAANTRPDVPIHQRLDLIDPVKGNRAPTNSKKNKGKIRNSG